MLVLREREEMFYKQTARITDVPIGTVTSAWRGAAPPARDPDRDPDRRVQKGDRMNCRDAEPRLKAYLDGELDLVRSLELEAHVGQCGGCRTALEGEKQLSAAVAGAAYYRATPSLRARLASWPTPVWRRARCGSPWPPRLYLRSW